MKSIKLAFRILSFLIFLASCSDEVEDKLDCKVKLKFVDNESNNLFQLGAYHCDTVFIYQDNIEEKSMFEYDNGKCVLSISNSVFNVESNNSNFYFYLNHLDTDTFKILFVRDLTIQCLGGLNVVGLVYNGSTALFSDDGFIIKKQKKSIHNSCYI